MTTVKYMGFEFNMKDFSEIVLGDVHTETVRLQKPFEVPDKMWVSAARPVAVRSIRFIMRDGSPGITLYGVEVGESIDIANIFMAMRSTSIEGVLDLSPFYSKQLKMTKAEEATWLAELEVNFNREVDATITRRKSEDEKILALAKKIDEFKAKP